MLLTVLWVIYCCPRFTDEDRSQEMVWTSGSKELGFKSSQAGSRVCAPTLSTTLSADGLAWCWVEYVGEGRDGLGGEIKHLGINQAFILEPLT